MNKFSYLYDGGPDSEVVGILGEIPKRWGRMDQLSRLATVETGRVLVREGLAGVRGRKIRAGLIGGTRYGSLVTDLDFARSSAGNPALASPLLFGYTLPNISLAEAASHYGLTGPVYSVFSDDPFSAALEDGARWLRNDPDLEFMLAGEFDIRPAAMDENTQVDPVDSVAVKIKVVRK